MVYNHRSFCLNIVRHFAELVISHSSLRGTPKQPYNK